MEKPTTPRDQAKSEGEPIAMPVGRFQEILDEMQKQSGKPLAGNKYTMCALTYSFTVGPQGATLQGWITYYDGTKIGFQASKITAYSGLAANAAASAMISILPPDRIKKSGTFRTSGFAFVGGSLDILIDGERITESSLPNAPAAMWSWSAEGEVAFTRAE